MFPLKSIYFKIISFKIITFKYKFCLIVEKMAKIQITLDGYKCERCTYEWVARKKDYPRVCPACKSPYWDKPRKTITNQI